MQFELGRFPFDVSTRALTIARLASDAGPEQVLAASLTRPAAIEVVPANGTDSDDAAPVAAAVRRVRERFDGPIIVKSNNAEIAAATAQSGASAIHDPSALDDPELLSTIVERQLSVIIDAPRLPGRTAVLQERLRVASAAGIERRRVAVVVGSIDEVADLDAVTMLETDDSAGIQGVHVAAVIAGVRLIAPAEIVATRRTVDTLAELLARRTVPPAQSRPRS